MSLCIQAIFHGYNTILIDLGHSCVNSSDTPKTTTYVTSPTTEPSTHNITGHCESITPPLPDLASTTTDFQAKAGLPVGDPSASMPTYTIHTEGKIAYSQNIFLTPPGLYYISFLCLCSMELLND